MSKWHKEGDFSNIINSGGDLNRRVGYLHAEGMQSLELTICGYQSNGDLRLALHLKDGKGEQEAANLFEKFKNAFLKNNIFGLLQNDTLFIIKTASINLPTTSNKDLFQKFISAIHSVKPFDKETLSDIYNTLGIKAIADENKFFNELKELVDQPSFDEALRRVLAVESESMLMKLASYCEEKQQLQNAITCYEKIDKKSEFYKVANEKIAYIYMQMPNLSAMANSSLSAEEVKECKELQLHYFLKSGEQNQAYIDRAYQDLSGGKITAEPDIKNIRLNAETLINIAYQTRDLREKNSKMAAEILELKRQLALATTSTSLSTSSALNSHGVFAQTTRLEDDSKNPANPKFSPGMSS